MKRPMDTAPNPATRNYPVALQAHGVGARLGGIDILKAIDLSVPKGRWTSIVGPNGAGKSSLLKALAGLLPVCGRVSFLGQDLAQWPRRERARQMAWLGQNETCADDLSVWDVVLLGRLPHQAWLSGPSPQDMAAVERALCTTQAWAWRERTLGQLSGGERQRVLLARVLAVEAEVMLMDEPLTNLDPPHQVDWLALVQALVAQGRTVVSVLHEVSMALHADEMLVMAQGQILHQGACSDAATQRAVEAVFEPCIEIHSLQGQWLALPRIHSFGPSNHAN